MERNAMRRLLFWKNDPDRKPLILKGARQVGKTWLMREFGKCCYENVVYLNFDEEEQLKSLFVTNKNPPSSTFPSILLDALISCLQWRNPPLTDRSPLA